MTFTTQQLANQINQNGANLDVWAGTNPGNQGQYIGPFTVYFNTLQNWITAHGGANPFGWDNVNGLTCNNGQQVVLQGPQQKSPFNDAFNDVRAHLGTNQFRLFQAAQAHINLAIFLPILG